MIPSVFDKDRSYDIYSKLLKDRIIFLSEEIDAHVASSIIAQILLLNIQDSQKDISLYIMSPGGSLTASLAIFDTMQFVSNPISTICIGEAYSGAALLLAGGTKGRRMALPSSRIMVHQLSSGVKGTANEIAVQHEELKKLTEILNDHFAKITGKSKEKIGKDLSHDNFMSPEEAVKYGLIDKIVHKK